MVAVDLTQEQERLEALCALKLLDTPPEARFDRITRLAARFFATPIALVSLVDAHRQWFKSRYGLILPETPRAFAFCNHAIESRQLLLVEDARRDPRFRDNPYVLGAPGIRFYAGQPLFSPEGYALGTLCVIDQKPRQLSSDQLESLRDFAQLVEEAIHNTTVATSAIERQSELDASEARFRATFEQAAVGIAHVDPQGQWLRVNRRLCEIIGYDAAQLEHLTYHSIMHPHDFDANIQLATELLQGTRPFYALEQRYIQQSGAIIWINVTVALVRTDSGEPAYFIAVAEDIQAKKLAEAELCAANAQLEQRVERRTRQLTEQTHMLALEIERRHASETRLRTVTDNLPVLIAYIDREFRYRFANHQYRIWFDLEPAAMLGRTVAELFGEEFFALRRAYMETCLTGESVSLQLEVDRRGEARILESCYIPHREDDHDAVLGFYVLSTDITLVKRQEDQLQLLARIDPLTGLLNRRGYQEKLREAVARSQRNGQALTLLFLDLDRFKHINDSLGHASGDEVLKEFARRLQATVRQTDTVARLAGDEFTVILEGIAGLADAAAVADKILAAIREPFHVGDTQLAVTASMGGTFMGDAPLPVELLEQRADAALYRAKAAGRDGWEMD